MTVPTKSSDTDQVLRPALDALAALTDEQRLEVFAHFCKSCGSDNPRCQCWNDE